MIPQTSTIVYHPKHRSWWPKHECVICGAKAIGFNFGAPTCAPCKGTFINSKEFFIKFFCFFILFS